MTARSPAAVAARLPVCARASLRSLALLVLIAACLLALSACDEVQSDTRTLRVGHSLPLDHPVHLGLERMATDLAMRSGGRMALAIYPAEQLGSEREMIELLQVGALDMTKVSASPLEGFKPEMGVFGLPYLFRDGAHYWQVLDGPVGAELLASLRPVRLVGLGYFDAGARSFYTKDKPVELPGDVSGKKIRVMNSAMAIATMRAFGASATPLASGEIYTSLQQGLIDAAENNPPTYLAQRHYEVAPYFSLDEHSAIPDVILLSAETDARLSEQEREWLRASMQVASEYQRALWAQATEDALARLKAEGVTITRPDKAPFREGVRPVYAELDNPAVAQLAERIAQVGAGE